MSDEKDRSASFLVDGLKARLPGAWQNPVPRSPERIEPMLNEIRRAWYSYSDQRLFQLLMNAIGGAGDPYYIEDSVLMEKLQTFGTPEP